MVVLFGLATMPLGMELQLAGDGLGHDERHVGSPCARRRSCRSAMAPAATSRGASTRDTAAGAEHKARSMPRGPAVSLASSTVTAHRRAPTASVEPAERAEAKYLMDSTREMALGQGGAQNHAHLPSRSDDGDPHRPIARDGAMVAVRMIRPRWPAPLERTPGVQFVGVLEVPADQEPTRQPGRPRLPPGVSSRATNMAVSLALRWWGSCRRWPHG